jgi:hypothetical protein
MKLTFAALAGGSGQARGDDYARTLQLAYEYGPPPGALRGRVASSLPPTSKTSRATSYCTETDDEALGSSRRPRRKNVAN